MEKVKMSLAACVLMVIAICAGIVIAGDVIVKEGSIDLAGDIAAAGNMNVTDKVEITGSDASGGTGIDATDVLVVTGGKGGQASQENPGGKGSDILLTSGIGGLSMDTGGNGGDVTLTTGAGGDSLGDGGDGGDIELTTGQGGDGDYGSDGSYGNIILAKNGGNVGIGTASPEYPLVVYGSASEEVSIWCEKKVSATDFLERECVYDKNKGSALNYIQDADYYIDAEGKIVHSRFYGYTSYSITDRSRPETELVTVTITDEETGLPVEKAIEVTYYPHEKVEEAIALGKEVEVLRQAVYELKQEIEMLKAQ